MGLGLGECVQSAGAELPAEAVLLVAAERGGCVDLVSVVDPHRSGPDPVCNREGGVVVAAAEPQDRQRGPLVGLDDDAVRDEESGDDLP